MAITAFRGMKPFPQLLFSAFVILVCFLAFLILSLIIAVPVFGFDSILSLPTLGDLENPQSLIVLKYFQTVQAIGLFILPPLILAYLYQGSISKYLYLNKSFQGSSFLMVIVLMVFMMPFINFTAELNSRLSLPSWLSDVEQWMRNSEEEAARLTEAFLNVRTIPGLAFNLFMVAFLPAIGEELLFRGVIQKIFTRMTRNHHWGIWISAILFSAMHMQFFGFIPRMVLGAVFGYLLVWSGSMWLPMLGHFLNNAIAVTAMFLVNNGTIGEGVEDYGSTSYYAATISLVIIAALLFLIKRENAGNKIVASEILY
ncbi:CPBP family intramembrane metalloprotease [Maribellus luteus]|uniref:CPBP family intramembrane metalloprotease n=1 Tax=Maribellus luteus TaxID=2305463 RepID=A0A399SYL7_9BACT|nr:CPBP family intramembrane glutamic endopeptidase [Maribellus luteus]RIJ48578.1 CPBP family intramembrane metalloprotease [Maribellus luteus]